MSKSIRRATSRKSKRPTTSAPKSVLVTDFLKADFVIPQSGGSMADSFTGSKVEADKVVRRLAGITATRGS